MQLDHARRLIVRRALLRRPPGPVRQAKPAAHPYTAFLVAFLLIVLVAALVVALITVGPLAAILFVLLGNLLAVALVRTGSKPVPPTIRRIPRRGWD